MTRPRTRPPVSMTHGCSLVELSAVVPDAARGAVTQALDALRLQDVLILRAALDGAPARLVARIATPAGIRTLD